MLKVVQVKVHAFGKVAKEVEGQERSNDEATDKDVKIQSTGEFERPTKIWDDIEYRSRNLIEIRGTSTKP